MLCPTDIQTVTGGEYDDTLPKLLPHEAEHLMMVLSELPEPSRSVTSQGPGSPTHYREAKPTEYGMPTLSLQRIQYILTKSMTSYLKRDLTSHLLLSIHMR